MRRPHNHHRKKAGKAKTPDRGSLEELAQAFQGLLMLLVSACGAVLGLFVLACIVAAMA